MATTAASSSSPVHHQRLGLRQLCREEGEGEGNDDGVVGPETTIMPHGRRLTFPPPPPTRIHQRYTSLFAGRRYRQAPAPGSTPRRPLAPRSMSIMEVVYYILTNKNCLPNANVLSELHSLLYMLQYTDRQTTKGLAIFLGWDIYGSLLQHDLQELNRVLSEKHEHKMKGCAVEGTAKQPFEGHLTNYIKCIHESSSKGSFDDLHCFVKGCCDMYALDNKYVEVGHQESSNKCHVESHGLQDFWSIHPEKSKEDISLFVILYNPGEPELWRLLKTSLGKPSGIWTNLIEMDRCTSYEQTKLHEEKAKYIFSSTSCLYCQKSSHDVQYFARVCNFATQRLQLCQHICRSNSSSRKPGFAPLEASSLSWIFSLLSLPVHPRSLCFLAFRILPKVLKLSPGLVSKLQEHVHPQLIDIAAGQLPELPHEILMDIFALLEIPDLVRAGSVCTSWNSAYTNLCKSGQRRRPQTPCLLYTSESAGENVACLYSLTEKRAYKLTLPEPPIHRRYLIGSSHGWVITVDERSEMHLVNPITNEQIALPSVITIEQVAPIYDSTGVICKYHYYAMNNNTRSVTSPPLTLPLGKLRYHLHHKALIFYDASVGSYIVVFIHYPGGQIVFARLGDEKWTRLPSHRYFQDCIYKDGLLYAVTSFGEIIAFDLSGPVLITKTIVDRVKNFSGMERFYIVQAPWGDLLQVRRPEVGIKKEVDGHQHQATFENKTKWMKIYKVCAVTRKLVQINSLDDHVLFLGSNQSLCCRATEYPQLKPNHVYFTDDVSCVEFTCKRGYRLNIGVLDFGSKRMEEIIFPRPWSNCLSPLFFIPNPRKMDLALHDEMQASL